MVARRRGLRRPGRSRGLTTADTNGQHTVDLAYEVAGPPTAPPMVLLHALGERASDWEPVLDRLVSHYRVVSVDLRGHGTSPRPGSYSYRLMRDDVLQLLDRLELDDVVLVGHSLGGVVAFMVAAHRPDRVARLVVEDVVPPYGRDRPVPEAPDGPVDFDWTVVPAIVRETNLGDRRRGPRSPTSPPRRCWSPVARRAMSRRS